MLSLLQKQSKYGILYAEKYVIFVYGNLSGHNGERRIYFKETKD